MNIFQLFFIKKGQERWRRRRNQINSFEIWVGHKAVADRIRWCHDVKLDCSWRCLWPNLVWVLLSSLFYFCLKDFYVCHCRPFYSSVGLVSLHVAHQIATLQIDNPEDCGQKFVSNSRVGLVLFLGIVLGTLCKEDRSESVIAKTPIPA